jgi:hypothetical protein
MNTAQKQQTTYREHQPLGLGAVARRMKGLLTDLLVLAKTSEGAWDKLPEGATSGTRRAQPKLPASPCGEARGQSSLRPVVVQVCVVVTALYAIRTEQRQQPNYRKHHTLGLCTVAR